MPLTLETIGDDALLVIATKLCFPLPLLCCTRSSRRAVQVHLDATALSNAQRKAQWLPQVVSRVSLVQWAIVHLKCTPTSMLCDVAARSGSWKVLQCLVRLGVTWAWMDLAETFRRSNKSLTVPNTPMREEVPKLLGLVCAGWTTSLRVHALARMQRACWSSREFCYEMHRLGGVPMLVELIACTSRGAACPLRREAAHLLRQVLQSASTTTGHGSPQDNDTDDVVDNLRPILHETIAYGAVQGLAQLMADGTTMAKTNAVLTLRVILRLQEQCKDTFPTITVLVDSGATQACHALLRELSTHAHLSMNVSTAMQLLYALVTHDERARDIAAATDLVVTLDATTGWSQKTAYAIKDRVRNLKRALSATVTEDGEASRKKFPGRRGWHRSPAAGAETRPTGCATGCHEACSRQGSARRQR
jgi:hypothetical protein